MQLSRNAAFLVHSVTTGGTTRIGLVASLADAISDWQATTRISPVFGVDEWGTETSDSFPFRRLHSLFFIGPIHPLRLLPRKSKRWKLWLTLGNYNVLLRVPPKDEEQVRAWLEAEHVRYERWTIRNGRVEDVSFSPATSMAGTWREQIAGLLGEKHPPQLHESLREYAPLMASAIARAEAIDARQADELLRTHEIITQITRAPLPTDDEEARQNRIYEKLGVLSVLNAGLSRFTSQAFSGSSPISHTESHYWIHSLLGTYVVNEALVAIRSFLLSSLGEYRIPQRLRRLSSVTNKRDLINLDSQDEFWTEDHLFGAALDSADLSSPLFPLITYVSGRDGFKSTDYTLSAPLAVVSACNSVRWTLRTLTHEVAHAIVRGVMTLLYPNSANLQDRAGAKELIETKKPAETLLDEIRRLLLVSIWVMDGVHKSFPRGEGGRHGGDVKSLLNDWHGEVSEIMTHVFDFLYFYGKDSSRYIRDIWSSWSVIPNIGYRVPEYVTRTICAIMAKHLRRPSPEDFAKEEVLTLLQELETDSTTRQDILPYVAEARQYINDTWPTLKRAIFARRGLVKIVSTFLYSDRAATMLLGEAHGSSGASERQGYSFLLLEFASRPIDNPLLFLEAYTGSAPPSAPHSTWMLYMLAFNTRGKDGSAS